MNNDFFCWALIVFYIKLDHPVVLMWLKTSPHTLPISVLIFSLASLMFLQVLTSSFFSVVLPSPGWSHKSLKENNLTAHLSPRRTPGFSTWSSLFSLNDFQLYISTKSSMTTTHSILTKCLPKSWVQKTRTEIWQILQDHYSSLSFPSHPQTWHKDSSFLLLKNILLWWLHPDSTSTLVFFIEGYTLQFV